MNFFSFLNDKKKELKKCTWDNTNTYIPQLEYGYVIKVYDGDTITVAGYPYKNSTPYRFSLRLNGIDTPELRTKCEKEKELGYLVKEKLQNKILNKIIYIKDISIEKYGRLLCNIYENKDDENSINQWIIDNNMGTIYNGEKKTTDWIEWHKNYYDNIKKIN